MYDTRDTEVLRESLQNFAHHHGKKILMAIAPIGSIDQTDLEFLAQDVELLQRVGMTMYIALRPDELVYSKIFTAINCQIVQVSDWQMIVLEARKLSASKVCLMCGADAIYTSHGPLNDLSVAQAEVMVGQEDLASEAQETLVFAIHACLAGVPRVHLFNAHRSGALLEELLTGRGAGVMIYGEAGFYKEVRYAQSQDRFAIMRLLQWLRQRESCLGFIRDRIAEFLVFTVDGNIYGCAHIFRYDDIMEISSFGHTTRFDAVEILQGFLEFAFKEARQQNINKVIIPVNDLPPLMAIMPWFSSLGFRKENGPTRLGRQKIWTTQLRDE